MSPGSVHLTSSSSLGQVQVEGTRAFLLSAEKHDVLFPTLPTRGRLSDICPTKWSLFLGYQQVSVQQELPGSWATIKFEPQGSLLLILNMNLFI